MRLLDPADRRLAFLLAALAGFVDGVGFLASGGYFVSFMSGNSTRMGAGLAVAPVVAATAAMLIASFVVGVVSVALVGRRVGGSTARAVLGISAVLIGAAAALAPFAKLPALALLAAAMGGLNGVFSNGSEVRFGLTYMTGALVRVGMHLAEALSGGERWLWVPFAALWLALSTGAASGAIAVTHWGLDVLWLPAIAAATLALAYRPARRQRFEQ